MRQAFFPFLVRSCVYFICLDVISMAALPCPAQVTPPPQATEATAPAQDPKALLLKRANENAIDGPDIQPWHLQASFTLFDDTGNVTDSGTIDELWANPHQYKTVETRSKSSRTIYGTQSGVFSTEENTDLPDILEQADDELFDPFLEFKNAMKNAIPDHRDVEQNSVKLNCLGMTKLNVGSTSIDFAGPAFCFNGDQLVLTGNTHSSDKPHWIRSNFENFQGRFVAGDLLATQNGKQIFKAHLEKLELLTNVRSSDFTPPSDVVREPAVIYLASGVEAGALVHKVEPEYPRSAQSSGISGKVVLQGTINTKGKIEDLQVISGPEQLRQSALKAVRQWVNRGT